MPAKKSFSSTENPKDEEHRDHGEQFERKEEEEEEEGEDPGGEEAKQRDPDEEEEEEGGDEEDEDEEEEVKGGKEDEEYVEEEGTIPSSTLEGKSEFMLVDLLEIRKDVQCPICLGIIKKTRTVMDCLHRFCRECIDKSMRLGNNECPACRKHCASRRSLRDDPKFDSIITALYPNILKFEEEELAFQEEERACNKQIQASIAQISQRQSEALVKRRSVGREAAVLARSQRNLGSRRRRNCRSTEHQPPEAHDGNNDDNNRDKDSSSADERCIEIRQRKRRRRSSSRSSQNSPLSGANNNSNNNGTCADNNGLEAYRESWGISPGLVWNPEILAWGRGGARSNTRHGNAPGGCSKSVRNARLNKLVQYLRSLENNSVELDVHLKLVSLDGTPSLQQPYLCCRPSLLVKQLREYIALQMHLKAEDIELLLAKGWFNATESQSILIASTSTNEMQSLEDDETLAGSGVHCSSRHEHLIVGYRQKHTGQRSHSLPSLSVVDTPCLRSQVEEAFTQVT